MMCCCFAAALSTALVAPSRPALGRAARARTTRMEFVDLFPDPAPPPSVGGNVVLAPAKLFPSALEQPEVSSPATITPFADAASVIFAPVEGMDLVATIFLGIGLMLGPDFALAPAGLVSNDGIRPGYSLESVVGSLITPDAQWLKDRREKLAADAPIQVRALVLLPFLAAGLLVNRLLLVALEDQGFVISLGIISCFGGGLLEVIRQPLPTRAERDLKAKLAVSLSLPAHHSSNPPVLAICNAACHLSPSLCA